MNTLTDLLTTYAPLSYGLAVPLVLILLALAANLLLYIRPSRRPLKSGQQGGGAAKINMWIVGDKPLKVSPEVVSDGVWERMLKEHREEQDRAFENMVREATKALAVGGGGGAFYREEPA